MRLSVLHITRPSLPCSTCSTCCSWVYDSWGAEVLSGCWCCFVLAFTTLSCTAFWTRVWGRYGVYGTRCILCLTWRYDACLVVTLDLCVSQVRSACTASQLVSHCPAPHWFHIARQVAGLPGCSYVWAGIIWGGTSAKQTAASVVATGYLYLFPMTLDSTRGQKDVFTYSIVLGALLWAFRCSFFGVALGMMPAAATAHGSATALQQVAALRNVTCVSGW
jgi:hypothetical protein